MIDITLPSTHALIVLRIIFWTNLQEVALNVASLHSQNFLKINASTVIIATLTELKNQEITSISTNVDTAKLMKLALEISVLPVPLINSLLNNQTLVLLEKAAIYPTFPPQRSMSGKIIAQLAKITFSLTQLR